MSYLPEIKNRDDLRRLTMNQLGELAEEIRQLIQNTVSKTGGHLASNLGVVELTIAMHTVFDAYHDKILWDVGHQCYVHKILTGRADKFDSLRQSGGISGFPAPSESEADQFAVGHAGTAIASALGIALGAQMRQTDEKVIAVVGDASIVNGLSFEGLNNTNLLNRQMLIILNDNSMAIDKTEGAFARYLTQLRVSRSYEDLQRRTRLMVRRLPAIGEALHDTLERIKGGMKAALLGRQIFEQLGIPYFGPVDGHDLPALIKLLGTLQDIDHPVLLHVQTEKGRGFAPASKDPTTFHSPSAFKVTGETAQFPDRVGKSFTSAFADALAEKMRKDDRIMALTAAMPDGTGLAKLRGEFPERVLDVGIAESAAVDIAAGLAKKGLKPVVAIYSTFLQRSFDQIFQEVALQNLPVVFCLDRAGLVGGDGAVHHGFCDVAMLRALPNINLIAPANEAEINGALDFAFNAPNATAIRYPRDMVPAELAEEVTPFQQGRAWTVQSGRDAVILAYGSLLQNALEAAEQLRKRSFDVGVVSARFAKPIDEKLIAELLTANSKTVIATLEDHSIVGGFGAAVLESAQEQKLDTRRIVRLAIPDRFIATASRSEQLTQAGLDTTAIVETLTKALQKN
ncbi:MAG: 1-deoxy-D-xylulose-5-phosphate synthase [Sedimentisphaerales bacterium]|nr:1-deoxy-D-xylulose-5-phosphate synthase [Sedimentisphaerales bacterium]